MTERIAHRDAALRARVVSIRPLLYDAGADPRVDRPGHVRAASGLVRIAGRLALVQDDAAFVALVSPEDRSVHAVPLPPGPGGARQFDDARGNKALKPDLEACVALPGDDEEILLGFGSGSGPLRERIAVLRGLDGAPRSEYLDAARLYARLRATPEFAGSEMNVEGALWLGDRVRLFNRGNGAPRDGLLPVDATCDLAWEALRAYLEDSAGAEPPAPFGVVRYYLGEVDGCRLGFTGAALVGGAVLFSAAAEASPDAVSDGPVAGSALGHIAPDGSTRWALLEGADGRRFDGKVEGVAPGDRPGTVLVVVDRDDPSVPSELCEVELEGPWPVDQPPGRASAR